MNWEKWKVQPRVILKNPNKKLKLLNVALGWTFLFTQFMKEMEKWNFQKSVNRLHLRDEKLGVLIIGLVCTFQVFEIPKETKKWDYSILVRNHQKNKSK